MDATNPADDAEGRLRKHTSNNILFREYTSRIEADRAVIGLTEALERSGYEPGKDVSVLLKGGGPGPCTVHLRVSRTSDDPDPSPEQVLHRLVLTWVEELADEHEVRCQSPTDPPTESGREDA